MIAYIRKLFEKKHIETHGRGRYGFFSLLWIGSSRTAFSHWIIMAIALVPLLLVQQVSRSMIEGIATRIIETDSYHLLLQPYSRELFSEDSVRELYRQKAEQVEGITSAFSEVRGIGIIKKGRNKTGINIRGIEQSLLEEPSFTKYMNLKAGTFDIFEKDTIVLGKSIAEKLEVSVGDNVQILTMRSGQGEGLLPKISNTKVAGIISTGYEELDKIWGFTSIQEAVSLIPESDREWYIGAKIQDPFAIPNDLISRSKKEIEGAIQTFERMRYALLQQGTIDTWYNKNYNQYLLFIDTKNILSMVMLIAVMLAAVTLSSTKSMQVVDMEIDIAMLKAVGANPRSLERQIFFQGLRYGFMGSLIGCIIGILLTSQVNNIIFIIDGIINAVRYVFGFTNPISILNPQYYLTKIPFHFYPQDMLFVALSALVLSVLAAWIPARRLRKISPLKMIRRH